MGPPAGVVTREGLGRCSGVVFYILMKTSRLEEYALENVRCDDRINTSEGRTILGVQQGNGQRHGRFLSSDSAWG